MARMDTLSNFAAHFLSILLEAAPFLLLGALTSGLIEAFLSHDDLMRFIPRHPVLAALAGSVLGFVFPVGECGVIPVARRLVRKGAPVPVGIAFLLAGPVVNPLVIASTYAAFHQRAVEIVTLRVIVALGVAVAVGVIFAFRAHPARLLGEANPPAARSALTKPPIRANLRTVGTTAAREFYELGRYLVLGALLAAGIQVIASQGALEKQADGPVSTALVMQALAFVLSQNSIADAFAARDFATTFAPGPVSGFLTFGPVVDASSMIMFLGVFRRRTVIYLILLSLLMTTLAALWITLNVRF